MARPKVLRIINRFNLGGPTLNVGYLSKYMDGYNTRLVGGLKDPSEDSSEFIVEGLGLDPIIIPEMRREINWKNDRIALKKIRAIIRDFRPDIVHTHASKAGALGRWAAYRENVPVIVHTFHGHVFHHYFNPIKTTLFKRVERFLASKSDAIIVLSQRQKEELCHEHQIFPASKAHIVPLGFELERFRTGQSEKRKQFREKFHIPGHKVAIGIVGRLVPIKNHRLFLEAFARLKKVESNLVAIIIGDGECREDLEALCKELSLSTNIGGNESADVIFTGWIRNVADAYPGLDVVALSSLNEGTPVSLIEAQASGLPIISTNVGGIADVVIPNKSALLSESLEVDDFFEIMKRVALDESLRKEMAHSATDFVMNKFSAERLSSDMSKVYEALLKSKL